MNTMPAVGVILWRSMIFYVKEYQPPVPRKWAAANWISFPASCDYHSRLDRINRGEKP